MNASILLALRRRRVMLLLVPLLAAIAVFVLSPSGINAGHYTASVTVAADPGQGVSAAALVQSAILMKQPFVADPAAKAYGTSEDPVAFARAIDTEVDAKNMILTLSSTGTDRDELRRYVGAFADAFVEVNNEAVKAASRDQIDEATRQLSEAQSAMFAFTLENTAALAGPDPDPALLNRQQELSSSVAERKATLDGIETELAGRKPLYSNLGIVGPKSTSSAVGPLSSPAVRAVLAWLIAFGGIAAVVVVAERLSPRVADRRHVEDLVGVPVLAMVPLRSALRRQRDRFERVTPKTFTGPISEAHRTLAVHLGFIDTVQREQGGAGIDAVVGAAGVQPPDGENEAGPGYSIVVTSAAPADGKTSTAALLATAFADADNDTLVVGCDFRRPTIHARFGVQMSPGLSDRRLQVPAPALAELIRRDELTGVRLVSSGRPTTRAADVLGDVRMMIRAGRAAGQRVVIDTAPVLVASETALIAAMADHVVLVVRAGVTSVRSLQEAVSTLELNHTPITGVVMIGSREASDYSYYYAQYTNPD